ncbi:hypothetical protein [Streptomyces sp. NBC_00996]|uniref:hypothetical protein n=1 Tax=Streptomyces sp. NBC_00996 TaxID=2903710 RepID=UPI003862EDE2|nr:hypothetical protein OG390_17120 [Streptomyces sp. NBC_00996]
MTNATTPRKLGVKMTIRVYSVNGDGAVTGDRGTVSVPYGQQPLPLDHAFPPCQCPRHLKVGAAR